MARIRTIKPEFFTSEDIVGLTPLARLFYVSLWCEADREGRLSWRSGTLKMRYLPGDDCDVDTVATELIDAGLIVLYEHDGKTYAEIPTFKSHQVINNREAESTIPARVHDASARVKAEGRKEGREGKGKEGKEVDRSPNGSRLPPDWVLPEDWQAWAQQERPDLDATTVAYHFRDYWVAKAGKDARKLDWEATWRNWVRGQRQAPAKASETAYQRSMRLRMQEAAPTIARQEPQQAADFFNSIDVQAREVNHEPTHRLG
jgi:hypothetical protein